MPVGELGAIHHRPTASLTLKKFKRLSASPPYPLVMGIASVPEEHTVYADLAFQTRSTALGQRASLLQRSFMRLANPIAVFNPKLEFDLTGSTA